MTSYRVPPVTIELGTVLEAVIERDGTHVRVHEWRGMRLLTDANALDMRAPRLYLVRAKPVRVPSVSAPQSKVDRAADGFARWTRRAADALYELAWGKPATVRQGRVVRLDYRSDKWGPKRRAHEYTHDFTENGGRSPLAYTDVQTLERARLVVLSGGSMRVTERGIA